MGRALGGSGGEGEGGVVSSWQISTFSKSPYYLYIRTKGVFFYIIDCLNCDKGYAIILSSF